MRLLFKLCVLAIAAFMILPLSGLRKNGIGLDGADAPAAITGTIADLSRFCVRQPDACRAARTALQEAASGARDLAGIAYRYLDSQPGAARQEGDSSATGSLAK